MKIERFEREIPLINVCVASEAFAVTNTSWLTCRCMAARHFLNGSQFSKGFCVLPPPGSALLNARARALIIMNCLIIRRKSASVAFARAHVCAAHCHFGLMHILWLFWRLSVFFCRAAPVIALHWLKKSRGKRRNQENHNWLLIDRFLLKNTVQLFSRLDLM